MKNYLKLYPYHTFLVIPFIVLFLYAYNLGQTTPEMTYRTLLIGAGISVVLFALFYLLYRNRLKTGVLVTIVLFALFQYGVLYEFLESLYFKGLWPFRNVHRYLILFYLIVFAVLIWAFKRTKRNFIQVNYFLNVLILLLVVFNLVRINVSPASKHAIAWDKQHNAKIIFKDKTGTPDIYYIILDGYASNATLKNNYHFNNDAFTNALKKLNFTFCDSAFSNYYFTSQSLSSTLNMNYHSDLSQLHSLMYDNLVFKTLRENGYKVYHLHSGYAVTSTFLNVDSTVSISGPKEFEKTLLRYTILRLDDLFGLFAHQRLASQFQNMFVMTRISSTPRFCFIHIVAPHPPFIFTRDGKVRKKNIAENSWGSAEAYVDQLIYVNKQIEKLATEIRTVDPKAVIMLQSDHGPWLPGKTREDVFAPRSKILYAYYSEKNLQIPSVTSSVNTFRYLFNGLFNCGLPILPDNYAGKQDLFKDPILLNKLNEN